MDMIRIYQNICKLQYVLIMLSHGQCVQVKSCNQIKGFPPLKCTTFLPVHTAPSSYSNASLYKNSATKFVWL